MEKQKLRIEYCAPCNYLPRTLWHAEELLSYLGSEIAGIELIPATKGRYIVSIGDHVLFSKEVEGRFPEPEELMVAVCAIIEKPVPKH